MATSTTFKLLSVEDYLALEERSESRHEYLGGHRLELTGSSERHSLLRNAIVDRLRTHLHGSPYRVYASAMKVKVANGFYYPDAVVTGEPFRPESVYLTMPRLIVEVADDRSTSRALLEKRVAYQNIDSVQECIVVFDHEKRIEVFRRSQDGGWEQETSIAGEHYRLTSIGFDCKVDDLYRDVE